MKKILLALVTFSIFSVLQAQNDPVIMEVGGQKISQSEFMKEFLPTVERGTTNAKNMTAAQKQEALVEYVNLFANFRAKILDAKAQGIDTTRELRFELAKYRNDLAVPYLVDSVTLVSLLKEAYERNHYSVHAAQILVRLRPDALPEDTLEAFKLITSYRNRVLAGEDFMQLAVEEFMRSNPNAKPRPNEGDLGYFTAFDMVYPFENAAYSLEIGEVSQPVRTRFGYHLVKLIDKVAVQGKLSIAHIWLSSADSNAQRSAIYDIYNKLQNGAPFERMALRSNDQSTAENGGEIPLASLSQLPSEYIHAVADLSDGQFSKPFFTKYGWHIVKLLHKDTLPPFSSMEPYYKQKMTVDPRGADSRKAFAAKARVKYGIVDRTVTPVPQAPAKRGRKAQPVAMQASLDRIIAAFPDSAFKAGRWNYDASQFDNPQVLVVLPNRTYNELDVARHVSRHIKKDQRPEEGGYFVRRNYEDFLDSVTRFYADSQLETEHPDLAEVVEEYRRGLMIFNYNDKNIWTKAIRDSAGFADFYARESVKKRLDNPADSIFFWRQRARVLTLDVADSAQLAPAKAAKLLKKAVKKDMSSREMKSLLEKNFDKKAVRAPVAVDLELVERTRQHLLADDQWAKGIYLTPKDKGYRALVVVQIIDPMLKAQSEARGYYLNLYQNEVESKLNEELRRKYNVKINWDVVNAIKY